MAKWNIDKLCRPKKYMGQIMAECDCQSKLCEDRGYCMADTPSPEAIVRAALERAAETASRWAPCGCSRDIRDLASDPAEVAAIIEVAGGKHELD